MDRELRKGTFAGFIGAGVASWLLVLALLVAGLFFWPVTRAAAAGGGGPCADMYNITKPTPAADELPGFTPAGDTAPSFPLGSYSYANPGENVRDLQLPGDPADLKSYGTDTSGRTIGTPDHAYAAWNRYLARVKANGKTPLSWSKWLNRYVPNMGNNNRGKAYEQYATELIGLGDEWLCQEQIPGSAQDRIFDAVNTDEKIAYEFKSGNSIVASQVAKDAEIARATGYRIQYVFGSRPRPYVLQRLRADGLNDPYVLQATPEMNNEAPPPAQDPAAHLLQPDQEPAQGSLNDLVDGSGENQQTADAVVDADQDDAAISGAEDQAAIEPGGIDFSTMQLRYVSMSPNASGLQYSFQVDDNAGDTPDFGGLQDAQLTSDSMFTWLALDPSTFWVNLNPVQPNEVIDPRLASTDAGRILLNSDLALKHSVAALQVPGPDNPTATEYWKELKGTNTALPCLGTFRVWIEPDTATVHDTGDQLYVIAAPLKVEAQRMNFVPPPGKACLLPQSVQDYDLGVFEKLILPQAQNLVNNDPSFADLRRVYASRVVAEWIRERDAVAPGAFHKIIDSGDVSRWPARTPWSPTQVYADYLKSYMNGDDSFPITYPINGVPRTFMYETGGVLFSSAPHAPIATQVFNTTYKTLPVTVAQSRQAPVHYLDTSTGWLGGGTLTAVPTPVTTVTPPSPAPAGPQLAQSGTVVRPYIATGLAAVATGTLVLAVPLRRTMRRKRHE